MRLALALLAVAALIGGCGSGDGPGAGGEAAVGSDRAAPRTGAGGEAPAASRDRSAERERAPRPPAPRCPEPPGRSGGAVALGECAEAAGRVIAIESVDPDGDGDLHVVVAGGGVTLPGVTVLDVSAALRPPRDPRLGSWAAGAGPVYRGSYGQRQIEVAEVVFAPR